MVGSAVSGRIHITGGHRPPLWREARIGLETAALLRDPILRGHGVEDGRGQPVLLIPGFMAGDGSLALMANWLRRTGHRPSKAGMLANVDCSGAAVERLEKRLEKLVREQGSRAAIVGQSRGGGLAKVLASRRPELVAGIVTLGSPQADPLAVHPLVRAQVRAVAAAGLAGSAGTLQVELPRGRLLHGLLGAPARRAPARCRLRLRVLGERRRGGLARLPRPGGRPPGGGAHEPLRHGRAPERLARGGRRPVRVPPRDAGSRRGRVRLAKAA